MTTKAFQSARLLKTLLVVTFTLLGNKLFAQVGPSGETEVVVFNTFTYEYIHDGNPPSPSWDVTGGNIVGTPILSGPYYYVDINWTTTGTGSVSFMSGSTVLGTLYITVSAPSSPPSAPYASGAILVGATSFEADWEPVASVESYRLDVSTVSNFASFVSGYNNLTAGGTNASVSGLTAGTTYYFRVRAVNAAGSSGNSNTVTMITCPAAPTASAGSNGTATSFTANWNTVSSATSYRLDVSTNSGFSSFVSGYNNLTVSGTSQSVTGLTVNTTYYYRVRAVNSGGTSFSSSTITMATATAPPTVSVASSITTSSFTANWNALTGATSYRLDVSTASNFSSFVSGYNNLTVAGTNQLVTGLSPANTYYYRVRTVNGYGSISNSSSNASLTTLTGPPTLNAGSSIGQSSFSISWSPVTGAASYAVYISINSGFTPFLGMYNPFSTTSTSITVAGLEANSTYYVKVRAVNASGPSGESNVVSVLTLPPPPTGLQVSSITSGSFVASWISPFTSHRLDVSTNASFTAIVSGYNNLAVTGTSQSVSGLTLKTATYYFRVRAVNASGASANSNAFLAVNFDRNYLNTVVIGKPGVTTDSQVESTATNDKTVKFDFVDGLGRPTQSVAMRQSPAQQDIVQAVVYDAFGREAVKHLPFVATDDGWYKFDFVGAGSASYASANNPQYDFYNSTDKVATDPMPYAVTIFENSPLNRPLKTGSPGQAWQPDEDPGVLTDKSVKTTYETNAHGEILNLVLNPTTGALTCGVGSLSHYPVGSLSVTRVMDEENNEVVEYKDKKGRIVCKAVQYATVSNVKKYAKTYYLYDDLGNLQLVLQPEAIKLLEGN